MYETIGTMSSDSKLLRIQNLDYLSVWYTKSKPDPVLRILLNNAF